MDKIDLIIFYNDFYYTWSQDADNAIISDYIFGWLGIGYIFADVLYLTDSYEIYAYQPCILKRI
jgi:hypothetical protein